MRKLAALPIREIRVVPFDTSWANQVPERFVDEVLVSLLDARLVSVGSNFRFGAGGHGNVGMLQSDMRFCTRVNTLLTSGPDVVLSTLVRREVTAGNVERPAELLGSPLTHPAHVTRNHTLAFAFSLAVPSSKVPSFAQRNWPLGDRSRVAV